MTEPATTPTLTALFTVTPVPIPSVSLRSASAGAPGSRFVIAGDGFSTNHQLQLYMTSTWHGGSQSKKAIAMIQTDSNGIILFSVLTDVSFAPGIYTITTNGDPVSLVNFEIDSNANLQLPELQGDVVDLYQALNVVQQIFLPLINR